MSKVVDLEARVASLEAELVRLRVIIEQTTEPQHPWWQKIAGKDTNDPLVEEATRLGQEWRESFRPLPRKRKKV